MEEIDEIEFVTLKALSQSIIENFNAGIQKVSRDGEKLAEEIVAVESELADTTDIKQIAKLSKLSEEKREELLKIIAVKNRMDLIVERNNSRIAYFDKILKSRGIYQTNFDKKLFGEMQTQESENISEKSLNLNKTLNTPVPKFIFGKLVYFKGKLLDFSIPENKDIIINADEEFIRSILSMYPSSISTVTAEELAHSAFKRKLLKELTYYIGAELKDGSIVKINEKLGDLLCFKSDYCDTFDDYINNIINSFNVQVKRYLRERFPDRLEEINTKLECDESSRFLYEPVQTENVVQDDETSFDVEIEIVEDEQPKDEVKTETLDDGTVRKSMVSKELTQAFSDPDAPSKEEKIETEDSTETSDVDKDLLELYGIVVDDDDKGE